MNYDEFRAAGHYLVDYISRYLQDVEKKPLFPDVEPSTLYKLFDEPIPTERSSLAEIQEVLEQTLIPYCTHVNHPGYMGLITPSPNPAGILADFLASAFNQNVGASPTMQSGLIPSDLSLLIASSSASIRRLY